MIKPGETVFIRYWLILRNPILSLMIEKRIIPVLGVVFLLAAAVPVLAQKSSFQYIFPANGSKAVSRATNIILRPGPILDARTINSKFITVTGAFSGKHAGKFVLSDDKKTMVFTPSTLFIYSERVTVKLSRGILTSVGLPVDSVTFLFTIQSQPKYGKSSLLSSGNPGDDLVEPDVFTVADRIEPTAVLSFSPTKIDHPEAGAIVLAPYWSEAPVGPDTSYLSIITDSGAVLWARPSRDKMINFAHNPDGRYTFYDEAKVKYYAMDSTFTIIDSFACGAGYWTDPHDIELLPHDHALLISCDTENQVDLSQYALEGNHSAGIVGAVIEEIDSLKQPIFIWRSLDSGGYRVPDMIEFPHGLDLPVIDEVHANSIQIDTDGNILLSARHLDEITKISRDSGKILWRWGGRNNQFTLLGDSIWFSHQHHVRRIANGHITVFDNGNDRRFHTSDPQVGDYSRACEYELDERAKTARLVWQFDNGRSDTSGSMGSVQRLPNGNTLVGWGVNNVYSNFGPTLTEVHPDGSIALEMYLGFPYLSYRAYWMPLTNEIKDAVPHYVSDIASRITMDAPYPNPCYGSASILINLPERMTVDMRVYDALGHEVRDLASGPLVAGPHNISFDGTGLANGVYHVILRANGRVFNQEIVLAH